MWAGSFSLQAALIFQILGSLPCLEVRSYLSEDIVEFELHIAWNDSCGNFLMVAGIHTIHTMLLRENTLLFVCLLFFPLPFDVYHFFYSGWRVEEVSLGKKCASKGVCWYALLASVYWRSYWTGIFSALLNFQMCITYLLLIWSLSHYNLLILFSYHSIATCVMLQSL